MSSSKPQFRAGRTPAGDDVFGRLDFHSLITGNSGSGKSYLVQSIMAQVPP